MKVKIFHKKFLFLFLLFFLLFSSNERVKKNIEVLQIMLTVILRQHSS